MKRVDLGQGIIFWNIGILKYWNGGTIDYLFGTRSRKSVGMVKQMEISLCPDCTRLLTYGLAMRVKCPHDPKPMCKKCDTQCYHGEYKAKIREVMKFSGMYLMNHGRLDMLYHYLR
jgi:hypothetical protein